MVVSVLNCEQRRLSKIDSGKSKPSCRRTGEYTGGDAALVLAGPAHSRPVREESSALYAVGGSIIDIPRDVDDDDAPISLHEERRLQPSGPAIVKKIVIPVLFDQFRND